MMTTPAITLPANLNNEDDDGLGSTLLRHASSPDQIVPGAVVAAGSERFWAWVRIVRVDDDGQVHFERLPTSAAPAAARASNAATPLR